MPWWAQVTCVFERKQHAGGTPWAMHGGKLAICKTRENVCKSNITHQTSRSREHSITPSCITKPVGLHHIRIFKHAQERLAAHRRQSSCIQWTIIPRHSYFPIIHLKVCLGQPSDQDQQRHLACLRRTRGLSPCTE